MTYPAVTDVPEFLLWREERRQSLARQDAVRWSTACASVCMAACLGLWVAVSLPVSAVPVPVEPPVAMAVDLAPLPAAVMPPAGAVQPVSPPALEPLPEMAAPPSPAIDPPVPLPKAEALRHMRRTPKEERTVRTIPGAPATPSPASVAPASQAAPPESSHSPGASVNAAHEKRSWQGEILGRLERFKRYPVEAQERHEEGVSLLLFSMDRQGRVLSAHIRRSSGHESLDRETLALLKRAEPLPVPPESIEGNVITLTVPISYGLEDQG